MRKGLNVAWARETVGKRVPKIIWYRQGSRIARRQEERDGMLAWSGGDEIGIPSNHPELPSYIALGHEIAHDSLGHGEQIGELVSSMCAEGKHSLDILQATGKLEKKQETEVAILQVYQLVASDSFDRESKEVITKYLGIIIGRSEAEELISKTEREARRRFPR